MMWDMNLSSPNAFLDDPILLAFDALPESKLLHQDQVALLLECKTRWLEEQRSQGAPPPYVQLGGRMVRYAVGPLRTWLRKVVADAPASPTARRAKDDAATLGYDEPLMRSGRRAKPLPAPTLGLFVATAQSADQWPFVLRAPYGRPVDFIDALLLDSHDDDISVWLTLDDYGKQLTRSLDHERAASGGEDLAATMKGVPLSQEKPLRF